MYSLWFEKKKKSWSSPDMVSSCVGNGFVSRLGADGAQCGCY